MGVRGYRGLQEVTRWHGLLEVRRGYSRLQGVTRGFRGLQEVIGVTSGYMK